MPKYITMYTYKLIIENLKATYPHFFLIFYGYYSYIQSQKRISIIKF